MALNRQLANLPDAITTDTSLNVGIGGTPSGSYKLDVTGTGRFSGALGVNGAVVSTPYTPIFWVNGTGGEFAVRNNGQEAYFHHTSAAYFGTTATGSTLYITSGAGATALTLSSTGAATFSSSVTANGNSEIIGGSGGSDWLRLTRTGVSQWAFNSNGTGLSFINNTSAVTALTLASTGAATFSSSVTTGGIIKVETNGATPQYFARNTGATGQGASAYFQVSGNTLYIGNGDQNYASLSDKFTIASTGAATFSSSVSVGDGSWLTFNNVNTLYSKAGVGLLIQQPDASTSTIFRNYLGSEYMRITSGGNAYFNTISGSGNLEKYYFVSDTNQTARFNNTNNVSGNIGIVNILGSNCNNTSSLHFLTSAGGNQFNVYGNGTYATSSDIRLKKNVETARNGYLEDINKIRIVKYNWNNQEDGEAKELGVIAQELEQIFPSLVQDGAKVDETEPYKVVKYSVFIPMLIKAIQEQQATITELTEKVNKLYIHHYGE